MPSAFFSSSSLLKGSLYAAIAAVMWAILPFALKQGFYFATPETLSWFRLASSATLLGSWLIATQGFNFVKKIHEFKWVLILASAGLAFNYVAYAYGLRLTTPADAQMLIQMGPFITTLLTFVLGQEKMSIHFGLGFLFAIVGFSVFYGDRSVHFFGEINHYQEGFWWIFGASFAWAIWAILHRDQTRKSPSQAWVINFVVWTLCALFITPLAKIDQLWPTSINDLAAHFFLLLFLSANTIIAYGCYSLAYLYAPTIVVNLIISTNPILAFLLNSESIGWKSWFGCGIVSLGLTITFAPQWYQLINQWLKAKSSR